MLTEQTIRLHYLSDQKRYFISEGLLMENPNQAIKFLKEKGYDPATSDRGKEIYDSITGFTRGDGYTHLMTKFHVNERMPLDDLQKLHEYLRINKQHVNRLPKPVVNYETYRELRRDIDDMEGMRALKKVYNMLPRHLKDATAKIDARTNESLKEYAAKFLNLTPEQQQEFMSKIRGYATIEEFIQSFGAYVTQMEAGDDYQTIKKKIEDTAGAHIAVDDPEKEILVALITSYSALKTLGCTSRWCIARDPSYYRQYKRGGKKYFIVWDFKYPVDNNQYMVATAYNRNSPEASQTHLKDDASTRFDVVVDQKGLSYEQLNKYLDNFQSEYLASMGDSVGLLKAIVDYKQNGIKEHLIQLVSQSEFVQEYGNATDVEIVGDDIDFGMDKESMKNALDLEDEYDTVSAYASNQSYYGDYYDSEEGKYMNSGLNQSNIDKVLELAKGVGYPPDKIREVKEDEGGIADFLEEYGMDSIVETYISEYGQAQESAEASAAQEQIDTIVFDVDSGELSINKMLEYLKEDETNFDTFDQFVESVKDGIDISTDAMYEARYQEMDLDELNRTVGNELDDKLNDLDDPNSELYKKSEGVREVRKVATELGFKDATDEEALFVKTEPDKTIFIQEVDVDWDDEENPEIKIYVTIKYGNFAHGNEVRGEEKTVKGWIPLKNLGNYMGQLKIPTMEEHLKRYKKLLKY